MKYIEAPNIYEENEDSIFLAGGITGCPDWQKEVIDNLGNSNLVLFSPRRKNFPIHDPSASDAQIKWEHDYLRKASSILFWFPCETLCPIVLYELGAWSMTNKQLFVGVHPNYERRRDVEIQTKYVRPDINVVYSLDDLCKQILSA
jgi:hypothetical protein